MAESGIQHGTTPPLLSPQLGLASEAAIKARIADTTGYPIHATSVVPGASNHGRDGVTYRLNKLVEKGRRPTIAGRAVANVADARIAAREWGPSLRSQSSREVEAREIREATSAQCLTHTLQTAVHRSSDSNHYAVDAAAWRARTGGEGPAWRD